MSVAGFIADQWTNYRVPHRAGSVFCPSPRC
jgi:hypothetical protein